IRGVRPGRVRYQVEFECLMVKSLLIVDDDPTQRRILEETIKRLGFGTKTASSGEQALQILEGPERGDISLVLLDLVMSGLDGMGVLDRLNGKPGIPPIIVQTAHGSIEAAINAMRAGAVDFVVKPVSPERLEVSIKSALKIEALAGEISRIKKKVEGTLTFADLVVRGEGKGSGKPFVVVNGGATPENLVESTLFGHEKGSFTGAVDKRVGKFQEADGGTLFLDEVGELPLEAQVKLLRALQDGEIDPVGSKKSINVNFRLISATNRNMIQLVREGKFREDLYYRLNVFPIWVPPLRERLGDVAELAQHFIARFAAEEGKRINGISDDALRLIKSYPWPGNVRQLENAVFRAVVLADGPELTVAEFPQIAAHVTGFDTAVPAAPAPAPKPGAFKGPAVLGAEDIIPQTIEIRSNGHDSALGIPVVTEAGDIRPLDEIE